MASEPALLPPVHRVVTGYTDDAKSVVRDNSLMATAPTKPTGTGPRVASVWTIDGPLPDLQDERDLAKSGYQKKQVVPTNGSRISIVDYPPGFITPMHRTVSLDYAIVIKGSIILHLDDGSTTLVEEGGIIVQRGTMHAWENPSSSDWSRVLYHLAASKAPFVTRNGKLEEIFAAPPHPAGRHVSRTKSKL